MSRESTCDCKSNLSQLIRKQFLRIEELENELSLVRCERDQLLHENERIMFNLQMISLKNSGSDNGYIDDNKRRPLAPILCANGDRRCDSYELSQEIMDKKVDMIIRKYGKEAVKACLVIQRAFRKYQISKRFRNLALNALREKEKNQSSQRSKSSMRSKRFSNASLQSSSSSTSSSTTHSIYNKNPLAINTNNVNSGNTHINGYPNTCIPRSPTMPSLQCKMVNFNNSARNSVPFHKSQQYDNIRKREYRVGMNLFNKTPPERGIQYLFEKRFIDDYIDDSKLTIKGENIEQMRKAAKVARFLITRKGLSKKMIGEYLGDLQSPFNQLVLKYFVKEMDFYGLELDDSLRRFQIYFRFPGEAQKIERMVEEFSIRYCECNRDKDKDDGEKTNKDDILILSYAIIMLNTDLHSPNIKRRMTKEEWIRNFKGVFKKELSEDYLLSIYDRIKQNEIKAGYDHCLQVYNVQSSLVPSSKSVAVPDLSSNTFRRLVCFCRLHEIIDLNKKEKQRQHQREVFLFNDLLLITKVYKKSSSHHSSMSQLYSYRSSILLSTVNVSLFSTNNYPYGIKISSRMEKDKTIILFNARNDTDRLRFFGDLEESIAEMNQMEMIRIQSTLRNNGTSCPSPSSMRGNCNGSMKSMSSSTMHSSTNVPNSNCTSLMDLSSSTSSSPSSLHSSPKSACTTPSSSLDSFLPKNDKSKKERLY